MILAKVEIKDIDLLPPQCIPVIEHQLQIRDGKLFDQHPNFTLLNAYYEVRVSELNVDIMNELRRYVFNKKAKGIYLRMEDDFVLTLDMAKQLSNLIYVCAFKPFVLDFNFDTIKHSQILGTLQGVDFVVLRGCGYWNYKNVKLEQGTVVYVSPGSDTHIHRIDEMRKSIESLNFPLLLQFPTSAVLYKTDSVVSVRREDAMRQRPPLVFYDDTKEIVKKLQHFDNVAGYVIENLAFDFNPGHPDSVFQIVHRFPSLPTPFPSSTLFPRKLSTSEPKIDEKKAIPEDSSNTFLGENGQVFEMDM